MIGVRPLRLLPVTLLLGLGACAGPGQTSMSWPELPGLGGGNETAALVAPRTILTDPSHLKGLAKREVAASLGEPTFARRDAPAEVWQYFGPGCILDVFLYDEKDNVQRVAYVQIRGPGPGQPAQPACVNEIIGGKRAQRAS